MRGTPVLSVQHQFAGTSGFDQVPERQGELYLVGSKSTQLTIHLSLHPESGCDVTNVVLEQASNLAYVWQADLYNQA